MGNWARELSNGSTKWKHVGDQRDTVYYTDKWFLVRQASKYGTAMNNDTTQKEPKKPKWPVLIWDEDKSDGGKEDKGEEEELEDKGKIKR